MTDQGDHVVLKCSNAACGLRYPSPADDPRRAACPLCEEPVAEVGSYADPPPLPAAPSTGGGQLVGVLDNIRSAVNVGMMLRVADGAGLDHVYLGGFTAAGDNPKVAKSALGAELAVPWTSCFDVTRCIDDLRADGFEIWALDFTATSAALQQVNARPERLAFVVGSERAGVDPEVLGLADRHIHLDMFGTKSTLNVGSAFGIAAYWLRILPVG